MAGNTFGKVFTVTTFGESHGPGIGVIVDGCPPGTALKSEDFVHDMARRRPGKRSFESPRKEEDRVEILSGVFEGLTTGTPIALFIRNRDADSRPYEKMRNIFRPGHADYSYFKRYGHVDFRGGGRASARETAARVAAGVVADKILSPIGTKVVCYTIELGCVRAEHFDIALMDESPFYCPDPDASRLMEEAAQKARNQGDSIGGIVEIRVTSCPAGLGEPVFDKLEADLAKAVMSVGAVKGVEIGAGFEAARLAGSKNNDPITPDGFASNNAGGILGGISNGDEIIIRAAVKPIPSISIEQDTIDRNGNPVKLTITGRHDATAIPRINPVLEAMVRITLADHYLRYMQVVRLKTEESMLST
ncbi:chorismate synthase [uncultured Desulfobacterium sp.]|uniref:Chorismate synthase n=1 Tax=uncultured Desulfobacterium sp. TaxID=201089 RepID=A0A445MRU3_9BACT|nr:chorismate synthase [uncultured Desulfobacterium sp.]